jgi:hypothetical protein
MTLVRMISEGKYLFIYQVQVHGSYFHLCPRSLAERYFLVTKNWAPVIRPQYSKSYQPGFCSWERLASRYEIDFECCFVFISKGTTMRKPSIDYTNEHSSVGNPPILDSPRYSMSPERTCVPRSDRAIRITSPPQAKVATRQNHQAQRSTTQGVASHDPT